MSVFAQKNSAVKYMPSGLSHIQKVQALVPQAMTAKVKFSAVSAAIFQNNLKHFAWKSGFISMSAYVFAHPAFVTYSEFAKGDPVVFVAGTVASNVTQITLSVAEFGEFLIGLPAAFIMSCIANCRDERAFMEALAKQGYDISQLSGIDFGVILVAFLLAAALTWPTSEPTLQTCLDTIGISKEEAIKVFISQIIINVVSAQKYIGKKLFPLIVSTAASNSLYAKDRRLRFAIEGEIAKMKDVLIEENNAQNFMLLFVAILGGYQSDSGFDLSKSLYLMNAAYHERSKPQLKAVKETLWSNLQAGLGVGVKGFFEHILPWAYPPAAITYLAALLNDMVKTRLGTPGGLGAYIGNLLRALDWGFSGIKLLTKIFQQIFKQQNWGVLLLLSLGSSFLAFVSFEGARATVKDSMADPLSFLKWLPVGVCLVCACIAAILINVVSMLRIAIKAGHAFNALWNGYRLGCAWSVRVLRPS